MKLQMYSVFDTKVGAFAPPMCFRSRGEAIRSFEQAACDGNNVIGKFRGDYKFYYLGDFDDQNGTFPSVFGVPDYVIGADELGLPGVVPAVSAFAKSGNGLLVNEEEEGR